MATTERPGGALSRSPRRSLHHHRGGLLAVVLLLAPLAVAQDAETELETGIALTRQGRFQEAIPHLAAARGHVAETFAAEFNLALCYVGTRQFPPAIQILGSLSDHAEHAAEVNNLLAQAWIGDHQPERALAAFRNAAAAAPKDEKLYLLVSEACLDEAFYDLGLRVLEAGLQKLPDSARLLFERGVVRAQMDDTTAAMEDFRRVQTLAPDTDIAWIAAAESAVLSGNVQEAVRAAREGIGRGHRHYLLLTLLGEALLRSGVTPANVADFAEARAALESAIAERPGYSSAHIALARVYLLDKNAPAAVEQLETARQLEPRNRAVYAELAVAYRRAGRPQQAREALIALAELNREEAARIGSAEGGHAGYVSDPSKPGEGTGASQSPRPPSPQ